MFDNEITDAIQDAEIIKNLLKNNTMKFKTKLGTKDTSVYGLRKYLEFDEDINFGIDLASATIEWEVGIELREWGVKDMYISIVSIALFAEITEWKEDSPDILHTIDTYLDLDDFNILKAIKIGNTISISDIEIDFACKEITIY